jgi:hypothetical protein
VLVTVGVVVTVGVGVGVGHGLTFLQLLQPITFKLSKYVVPPFQVKLGGLSPKSTSIIN